MTYPLPQDSWALSGTPILAEPRPRLGFPLDLYELVPLLVGLYPDWSCDEVADFLEEKTRHRVHPEDRITLNAVYRRCRASGA